MAESSRRQQTSSTRIEKEPNRVSNVAWGGGLLLPYNDGIYINPFVEKDINGKIVEIGFNIENVSNYSVEHLHTSELGKIEYIYFRLKDRHEIILRVYNQGFKEHMVGATSDDYNSLYDKRETGTAVITVNDFAELANAKAITCGVIGSRQTVKYSGNDILPEFLNNIRDFYVSEVR